MDRQNAPAPTFSETRINEIRSGGRKFVSLVESKIRDNPATLMVDRVQAPDGGSRYEVSDESGVVYSKAQAWDMATAQDWRQGDPEPVVVTRVARAMVAIQDLKVIAGRLEAIGGERLADGDSPAALAAIEEFAARFDLLARSLQATAARSH